ncbi:hypothetical protein M0802_015164 [Mischocyttarus mexicanus]|nr:hypothetical protein M0802_015163 [Mischocyttarus mexicanus]KAI4475399.1 hypothetical protein M0802_015164 [Mischocyttarus mexicanus]
MGAANSSNILPSSSASSIPLRTRNIENPIEVNFPQDNILHCVDGVNEDTLRSTSYNITGEPRAQEIKLINTKIENTIVRCQNMAYVTRTTDWKPVGEASNSSSSLRLKHRENMELSQIILQLAKANQQLANAHTTALAQLEGLYLELQREKNGQKLISNNNELNSSSNIASRKRLTSQETKVESEDDNDSRIKLERRIERLENVVSERSNIFRDEQQQKNISQDRVPCNTNSDKILSDKNTRSYEKYDQEHTERLTDEEMIELFEEMRVLKADKVEYQNTNERLNANIVEQKKYTEKLCKDYEVGIILRFSF